MNVRLRRSFTIGTATPAGVSLASPAVSAGSKPGRPPAIGWKPCPTYSAYRKLAARLQCGTLRVPLDHTRPRGRQITIAVTRLPATGHARRLGSIAVNPGGPGGSGYLMPVKMSLGGRVGARLNERRLSSFGVSWGSRLGPVYRELFPTKVGRMWAESVAIPDPRMDRFEAVRSKATARDFGRMAGWMARFDSTYGFGATGSQVVTALARMRADFAAHPRKFTDVRWPVDGIMIARLATQPAPAEPPGVPEVINETAANAIFCNGDGGARGFRSGWAAYQDRLRCYPVTGVRSSTLNPCAGWPLPVVPVQISSNDRRNELSQLKEALR